MKYRPTIGLEIHAELKTRTKMFCACANDPEEVRPNWNVCPICLAHPGTLPVANKEAVRHVLRVGAAIGGTLADYSEFDRKSYFYPDIPKGYQISQYAYPFVTGGALGGVAITRVHLEEDTARSTHGQGNETGESLVDFNRAGVPLMELVTEPVIHDAATAGAFARELQLLLRTLGASEANLEKGEMRIEANVSVALEGSATLGTKAEVKNINSFRAVERAIAFEIERQSKALDAGEPLVQETRGWDEDTQTTFHQRFKEGSADYRYFPEPDLPKLFLASHPELSPDAIRATLPELPQAKRERLSALGLSADATAFLIATKERSLFFDAVVAALEGDAALAKLAANLITTELAGIYAASGAEEFATVTPGALAKLARMTATGELSSRGAKDTLAVMAQDGGEPDAIAKDRGFIQVQDEGVLKAAVHDVIAANEGVVADYKAGKQAALQFLVGQAMKATKGAGNPGKLRELLAAEIG